MSASEPDRSTSPGGAAPGGGRATKVGRDALAIRRAVRASLTGAAGQRAAGERAAGERAAGKPRSVLVACSGGADSLALAAATAFVATRCGWSAGLVTVDHQLQAGSAERAAVVASWGASIGLDPVLVRTVTVAGAGGPEAAARSARYAALVAAAQEVGAARGGGPALVLLGHTRDDQAETVLLALLRGSGPSGLAGMPATREVDGVILSRPLLDLPRATTRAAAAELGLPVWDDPHNADPAYRRTHARALLPVLVEALGEPVVANLARTARLVAQDTQLLDALAAAALVDATTRDGLRAAAVAELAPALRGRVLHRWAIGVGAHPGALSHRHVAALAALVLDWHGQGAVGLPGGVAVRRRGALLVVVDHGDDH